MRFDLTVNQFKSMFFDKALIEGKIDRATYFVMIRIGAYIRRTAMQSLRRPSRRKKPQPGLPPRNMTGKLKYRIMFGWEPTKRKTLVGPEYLPRMPRNPTIPQLLEYGGTIQRTSKRSKRRYMAKYPAYPYMRPALAKNLPLLPRLWRDTIR